MISPLRSSQEIVQAIRRTARALGWAIGEHGSMVRDIDLIAAPWREEAKPYTEVIAAIAKECNLDLLGSATPEMPHQRRCQLFLQPGAEYEWKTDPDGGRSPAHEKGSWSPAVIDLSFVGGPNP